MRIRNKNDRSEYAGFLHTEHLTPDGERLPLVAIVRKGRQRFSGPWYPPGDYRVLINPGTDRITETVSFQAGVQTRLILRSGGILWRHSGPYLGDQKTR